MQKRILAPALLTAVLLVGQLLPLAAVTKPVPPHGPSDPSNLPFGAVAAFSSAFSGQHAATLASQAVTASTNTSVRPLLTGPAFTSDLPVKNLNGLAAANGALYPIHQYKMASLPNDPSASQSWVTQANLSAAWDTPHGATSPLVALIDTGVALNHEELKNHWYTNTGETGPTTRENPSILNCTDRGLPLDQSCNLIDDNGDGIVDNETGPTTVQAPSLKNCTDQGKPLDKSCNLIDDDGNGYMDDVHGWDFADNYPSVQAGKVNPNGSGTHHGTYTSGVIGATGNNGVGIAGVDWNANILPIQALDDNGSGTTVSVANAINYAVSRGARIISMSLGSTYDDPLVHQAVRQAIASGAVVVAAAGNDGCNCMLYPANYPEVLSVGALDTNGQPAYFTSFGANLKIMAPGVNFITTDWQPGNQTSAYASGIAGTSLATPVVSGLLSRMWSQQPNDSALQITAALTENTNRTGLASGTTRSDTLGFGLVDGGKASQRVLTPYDPVQVYGFSRVSNGNVLSAEATNSSSPYSLATGTTGTTPMYLLTKNGSSFFTVSTAENGAAQDQGYSSQFYGYVSLLQPQDQPQVLRSINVMSEFLNQPTIK